MARFLTTKGIGHEIERLISHAEQFVYILTYSLDIKAEYIEKFKHAIERNVKIYIVFGVNNLKEENFDNLKYLNNIQVKYREHLHAKIYMNEKEFILTSMNLSSYSEDNNVEMGMHFAKSFDLNIYNEAFREVEEIIEQSSLVRPMMPFEIKMQKPENERNSKTSSKIKTGYCIRTGVEIPFDINKPLCYSAYQIWSEHNNPDYPENYCHFSGEPSYGKTSYGYPVLQKNWKKAVKTHRINDTSY